MVLLPGCSHEHKSAHRTHFNYAMVTPVSGKKLRTFITVMMQFQYPSHYSVCYINFTVLYQTLA